MLPREQVAAALARDKTHPAIVAFLTAGYPRPETFLDTLRRVGDAADAIEIGVPFSDPMADGVTIQRSSRAAMAGAISWGSTTTAIVSMRSSSISRGISSHRFSRAIRLRTG